MPRSGIAESYGHSMFNFLKEPPDGFSFYIPTSNAQGFQFLNTLSNIDVFIFLILMSVNWYLILVLIRISLMYVFFFYGGGGTAKQT